MNDTPRPPKAALLETEDAKRVLDLLRSSTTVVLTTHEGPDGDGLGSEIALCRALRRLGKRVRIVNPGPTVRRFRFLDTGDDIVTWKPELRTAILDADLALLIDTGEPRRATTHLEDPFRARTGPIAAIDHHPANEHTIQGILGPDFSSTGELMVHVLRRLGVELTPDLADPLYAAILFDTNQFQFVRNDPEVFRVAGDLIAAGADAQTTARELFGTVSRDSMTLACRVLGSATFEAGGRLAWGIVTGETTAGLSVDRDEVRNTVMTLAGIEGVQIAVMFKSFDEREGSRVKISMRSRGGPRIGDVAEALGGGGHPCAAGADVELTLQEAIDRTLPLLRQKLGKN